MGIPKDAKQIAEDDDYAVSRDGRVFSRKSGKWTEKKTSVNAGGYKVVGLWMGKNAIRYVHRLVLETFCGPCPPGQECLHGDGDRANAAVANLRWGTRKENIEDAMRHGTATVGARNGAAKLSAHDAGFMRDMNSMGFTVSEIKNFWPVSEATIRRVINNQTYREENI